MSWRVPRSGDVSRLASARPAPWRPVGRFLQAYLDSGASQYAGMLAFSLFIALLPLLLGLLTVWGFIAGRVGHEDRFRVLKQLLIDMFPADVQGAVAQVVREAGEHPGGVAVASLAGLVWFSTGVFSCTGFALNHIYGMPDRPFVQQRLRGLWMPLALFASAYLAVGVNIAIRFYSVPAWFGPVAIWLALTYFIAFLYRFAPSREHHRADVLPGAALAAAGIVGVSYAFPLYAELTGHLGTGSRFFATVFGLVAWLYFIAQAILLGAVFNRVRIAAAARQAGAAQRSRLPSSPAGEPIAQGVADRSE